MGCSLCCNSVTRSPGHCIIGRWHRRAVAGAARGGREPLAQRVQAFNDELRSHTIDLTVVMGVEYLLSPELLEDVQQGTVVGLNGSRYVLVEIDFLQHPPYTDEALFQLQLEGVSPVLPDPERQATIQEQPELLAGLVKLNAAEAPLVTWLRVRVKEAVS